MLLELKNVSRTFIDKKEKYEVLKNISLSIKNGDFIALTGESGAGKTTFIGIISLNDTFTGDIFIDGENAALMSDSAKSAIKNKKIGILCQNYNLFPDMTIRENILLPLEYAAKGSEHYSCEELADFLGIKDKLDSYPGTLSGGERQRAALARALICSPELLIADEPTRNLDNENAAKLMSLFRKLAEKGIAVLVSTHDKAIAAQADRQIVLIHGGIQEISPDNGKCLENAEELLLKKLDKSDGKSKIGLKTKIRHDFGFLLRHKAKSIITFLLFTFTITSCLAAYALFIGKDLEDKAKENIELNPKNITGSITEFYIYDEEKKFTFDDILALFPQDSIERIGYVNKITLHKDYAVKSSSNAELPDGIDIFTYPEWLFNANMRYHRNLGKNISIMNDLTAVFTKDAYESLSGKQYSLRKKINIGRQSLAVLGAFEKDEIFYSHYIPDKALLLPENALSNIPHEEKAIILATKVKGDGSEKEYDIVANKLMELNEGKLPGISIFSWNDIRTMITNTYMILKILVIILYSVPLALCGFAMISLMLSGLKEKTREIAIRKILGLNNKKTFINCIKETFALTACCCISGGIIGTVLGHYIVKDFKESIPCAGVAESISGIFIPKAFLITFAIIIVMSLIAGIIPAIKSSRISPMEALKD